MVTFPTWRTSEKVAPVDGDKEMTPAEVAAGISGGGRWCRSRNGSSGSGCWCRISGSGRWRRSCQRSTRPRGRCRVADPVAGNQMNRLRRRDLRTIGHTFLLLIGAKAACVDAAEMTLTKRGRTMLRKTQYQSFNATVYFSKQRRRTSCARQSARSIRKTTTR